MCWAKTSTGTASVAGAQGGLADRGIGREAAHQEQGDPPLAPRRRAPHVPELQIEEGLVVDGWHQRLDHPAEARRHPAGEDHHPHLTPSDRRTAGRRELPSRRVSGLGQGPDRPLGRHLHPSRDAVTSLKIPPRSQLFPQFFESRAIEAPRMKLGESLVVQYELSHTARTRARTPAPCRGDHTAPPEAP